MVEGAHHDTIEWDSESFTFEKTSQIGSNMIWGITRAGVFVGDHGNVDASAKLQCWSMEIVYRFNHAIFHQICTFEDHNIVWGHH
ncbi:hypothetical protein O181_008782 [Austropuccinia psidii MF-1]|uniref:Uncharacterized protein n=1 Tax=Austropuccinia psidii MF-1 TaxID=1389203 RepID=A0A9Q3BQF1_9BASI|nr:hypothetical protein [Austropuccinia psidii MF-1]